MYSHIVDEELSYAVVDSYKNVTNARYWTGFNRWDDSTDNPFDVFRANNPNTACSCNQMQTPAGMIKGSDGNCYMKDFYRRYFAEAETNCDDMGMRLAKFSDAGEYAAVTAMFGKNDDLWIGAHNPGAATCTGAACAFQWKDDATAVDCSAGVNANGCESANGFPCLVMDRAGSGKLMDEVCTAPRASLCQVMCGVSGHNDILPRDCSAMEIDTMGDSPAFLKGICSEDSFYMCEVPQTLKADTQSYMPSVAVALTLTRDDGPSETSFNLKTVEYNVGYDSERTPAMLTGAALFGGAQFEMSEVSVDNLEGRVKGDQVSALLWVKSKEMAVSAQKKVILVRKQITRAYRGIDLSVYIFSMSGL